MTTSLGKKIALALTTGLSFLVLAGCWSKTIMTTSTVSIKYTANFEDGTLFEEKEVTGQVLGQGQLIQGLEESLLGMKKGDQKELSIVPEKGYGKYYDSAKIQKIAKEILGNLEIGSVVKIGNEDATVIGYEGEDSGTIILDLNPKNTRKNLVYKIEILEVK